MAACAKIELMKNGKKAVTGVVGVIVLVGAAWFGIDLSDRSGTDLQAETTARFSTPASPSPEGSTPAASHAATISDLPSCTVKELPDQADLVVDDILAGGPFDYPDNDGVRFGNYEGILPDESGNYYREYTVETPGLNHRGPLRIVTGGSQETDPDVWYFTEDHYDSFCEITDAEY